MVVVYMGTVLFYSFFRLLVELFVLWWEECCQVNVCQLLVGKSVIAVPY